MINPSPVSTPLSVYVSIYNMYAGGPKTFVLLRLAVVSLRTKITTTTRPAKNSGERRTVALRLRYPSR